MIGLICASVGLAVSAERQVGFVSLSPAAFSKQGAELTAEVKLEFPASEIVPSWNVAVPGGGGIEVRLTALYPDRVTKAYHLGKWSLTGADRTSINEQDDADGKVQTDILRLTRPADRLRIEISLLPGAGGELPNFKRIHLSYLERGIMGQRPAYKPAWGTELRVPTRAQHDYEGGNVLCSPACIAMMLHYWAEQKSQPAWTREVPEIKEAIYDPGWEGTGNWPFNTALPGSMPGLVGAVSRLRDVRDLEMLTQKGIPVAVSVSYPLLLGQPRSKSDDGHLVVVIGFDQAGDPIVNDPAKRADVRQIYPRQRLVDGWAASQNTIYLIYPEGWSLPAEAGPWPKA